MNILWTSTSRISIQICQTMICPIFITFGETEFKGLHFFDVIGIVSKKSDSYKNYII